MASACAHLGCCCCLHSFVTAPFPKKKKKKKKKLLVLCPHSLQKRQTPTPGCRSAVRNKTTKWAVYHTKSALGAGTCPATEAASVGLPGAIKPSGVCNSPLYPTDRAQGTWEQAGGLWSERGSKPCALFCRGGPCPIWCGPQRTPQVDPREL